MDNPPTATDDEPTPIIGKRRDHPTHTASDAKRSRHSQDSDDEGYHTKNSSQPRPKKRNPPEVEADTKRDLPWGQMFTLPAIISPWVFRAFGGAVWPAGGQEEIGRECSGSQPSGSSTDETAQQSTDNGTDQNFDMDGPPSSPNATQHPSDLDPPASHPSTNETVQQTTVDGTDNHGPNEATSSPGAPEHPLDNPDSGPNGDTHQGDGANIFVDVDVEMGEATLPNTNGNGVTDGAQPQQAPPTDQGPIPTTSSDPPGRTSKPKRRISKLPPAAIFERRLTRSMSRIAVGEETQSDGTPSGSKDTPSNIDVGPPKPQRRFSYKSHAMPKPNVAPSEPVVVGFSPDFNASNNDGGKQKVPPIFEESEEDRTSQASGSASGKGPVEGNEENGTHKMSEKARGKQKAPPIVEGGGVNGQDEGSERGESGDDMNIDEDWVDEVETDRTQSRSSPKPTKKPSAKTTRRSKATSFKPVPNPIASSNTPPTASGSHTESNRPKPGGAGAPNPTDPRNRTPKPTGSFQSGTSGPPNPKPSEVPQPKSPIIDHTPFISLITNNFQQLHAVLLKEQAESRKLLLEVKKTQASLDARLSQHPPTASAPHESSEPGPSTTLPPPPRLPKRPSSRKTKPVEHKDDPRRSSFLRHIRTHLLRLLGITALDNTLCKLVPLTDEEITNYEERVVGCIAITASQFRLDMSRSRAHPFNVEAVEIFAEDFLRRVKQENWYQDPPIPEEFLNENLVISTVTDHLKHVFAVYKRVSAPNTPENRKKEVERLERASRSVRKGQLYTSRLFTVQDDDTLKKHLDVMSRMKQGAASSDESDDDDKNLFWRIRPAWRSRELEIFLWRLDEIIAKNKSVNIGTRRKAAGRAPRNRRYGEKINEFAMAPPNLPRNCYDAEWLQTLRPMQKKLLNIQPVDHSFFLSGDEFPLDADETMNMDGGEPQS